MTQPLINRIDEYEGVALDFYDDDGVQAIGPGIRVTDPLYLDIIPEDVQSGERSLTKPEYDVAKKKRLDLALSESKKLFPEYAPEVSEALTDMLYNFGMKRLANNMPGFTDAIQSGDYSRAAEEIRYKDPDNKEKGTTLYWKKNYKRASDNYRILKEYGDTNNNSK